MKFSLLAALILLQAVACESADDNLFEHRNLFEQIHSYTPQSLVTDANALDRDLYVIRNELEKETKRGWSNAESVYRDGANSKPVALLTLHKALKEDIDEGTIVRGLDVDGYEVVGTLYEGAKNGTQDLVIQYHIKEDQKNYVNCQVGASPAPNFGGCFNSSGKVLMFQEEFSYDYDVMEENVNYRAIEDLSGQAQQKMWECRHCPFPDFEKFYNYYGEYNYADRIITSAFRGQQTYLKNGNMDFGFYTEYGLGSFIHKAMSYMPIFMYCIRQMEQAVAECEDGENEKGAHFWDEAVAYYSGSRSLDPNSNGYLIFHQAELRCGEFSSCGENHDSLDGQSYVNIEAFKHFNDGQNNIEFGRCELARKNKERIVAMMKIPLIQGTLRYAHIISHEDQFYEKHGAEATMFALSVLPFVHDCSKHDAKVIHENMKSKDNANVDFLAVKKAFENNYHCMNIQCGEVGGIWDEATGDFKYDSLPCGQKSSLPLILGGVCGGLLVIAIIGYVVLKRKQKKMQQEAAEQIQGDNRDWDVKSEGSMEDVPWDVASGESVEDTAVRNKSFI